MGVGGFGGPLSSTWNGDAAKFVSQDFVVRTNRLWEQNTGKHLLGRSPDEVRQVIRQYITTGIDFLKYSGSGLIGVRGVRGTVTLTPLNTSRPLS